MAAPQQVLSDNVALDVIAGVLQKWGPDAALAEVKKLVEATGRRLSDFE